MKATTDEPTQPQRGLTWRALLIATIGAWLSGLWMREAGLYGHAVQLGESVPVIPAVAALVFFLIANPLLFRVHARLALNRAELFVVFTIMSIAPVMNSIGLMRMLLPMMISPRYFATPENKLDVVWERIPRWFGPRDEKLIFDAFRGHQPEVPWEAWAPGLTVWFLFCLAIYCVLLALSTVFRRQWTERERLTFPLMQVVEELTPSDDGRTAPMLRDQLFWLGLSLPLIYNLVQMAHAFFPAFPEIGRFFDIGAGITTRPWAAIKPLQIYYRPELVGLGYLMSTEVTFSIWFCFLALRLTSVLGAATGWVDVGSMFPYDQSQSMGAYIALALISLYLGRQALSDVFRKAVWNDPEVDDSNEPMSYRTAVLVLLLALGFIFFVCIKAGMGWPLALLFFFFVFAVAMVYTRVRAETGAPMIWLFPFWQQEKMIFSLFGSSPFAGGNNGQPLVILASFTWLSRGFYPNAAMSIQMDSMKLAANSRMPQRQMSAALLYGMILGFGIAVWIHLTTYYDIGAEFAERGGRAKLQNSGYVNAANILTGVARKPHLGEAGAGLAGFLLAFGMVIARVRIVGFPLHPLGYAMTTAYGRPLWGSALIVWAAKTMILRAGGIKLFRRYIPFFLGILVGHFFAAGVVWGLVAVWYPEVTYNYVVYFG